MKEEYEVVRVLENRKEEVNGILKEIRGNENINNLEEELNYCLKFKNLEIFHSQFGTTKEQTIDVNGERREFVIHTPLKYNEEKWKKVKERKK